MFYPFFQFAALIALVAIAPSSIRAEVDLQGLVSHSPFGEGKVGTNGERTGALEFRGYYVDNGITYFSIYNPASKSSVWVAEGETSTSPFAVSVKNFDPEKNTVTLESAGQSMRLSLHEAVIVKMELPATPVAASTGNNNATPTAPVATMGGVGTGAAVTAEQAQSFKDSVRQRWQDRQNQNNGSENTKKTKSQSSDTSTTSENSAQSSGRKNKGN